MQAQVTPPIGGLQAIVTSRGADICSAPDERSRHDFPMKGTLAERIVLARTRLKWNQSDLARAMKVSPQTVQQWEKGGGVRQSKAEELARKLQATPDWLFFGHGPGPGEPLNKRETVSSKTGAESHLGEMDVSTLKDTIAGLRWRYQLAGMDFVVEQELEILALALSWALDPSPARQSALTEALEPRLKPAPTETVPHGSATTPHRSHRTGRR